MNTEAKAVPRNDRMLLGYVASVGIISIVSDGWSNKPSPLVHQLLLLPLSVCLALTLISLLNWKREGTFRSSAVYVRRGVSLLGIWEALSVVLIEAESRHYRQFGYHLTHWAVLAGLLCAGFLWTIYLWRRGPAQLFSAILGTYAIGSVVSIFSFPLNYLRSDMLPVIGWADARLVHHLNPYTTMHIGTRLYDFPYLPGMLVAFAPAVAASLDLRWADLVYLSCGVLLIYFAASSARRKQAALLLGLFVLCPFLQYRHDLYLEPHWFTMALAVVLMQRRRFLWSALVWGVSSAIYQLSWVLVPFVFLYAYRRRGFVEAMRQIAVSLLGFFLIVGPFLKVALHQVANNTVGQWSRMPHALADPINLSYWLTYLIRPDQLRWVQAIVLVGIFGYTFWKGRCRTLTDTLRWMTVALALFIPLNVLVDGYFYLTLLWLLLLYLCCASGVWVTDDDLPVELQSLSQSTP